MVALVRSAGERHSLGTVQGDIGTFLVLIALTLLVKLLTDKPAGG